MGNEETAAGLFAMNLANWRRNAFVAENYSESEIDALAEELRSIADGPDDRRGIVWRLRQIVYERPGGGGLQSPPWPGTSSGLA